MRSNYKSLFSTKEKITVYKHRKVTTIGVVETGGLKRSFVMIMDQERKSEC